jgi:hypothetical protein
MNSPIKNIAAITDFSKDFTKFQVNNLALISSVADEIKPGLSSGLMDGYFMERVDELVEDLYIIASQDMSKERQLQIKASCISWVNQHLRTASNMTLVALTLWLDGAEDGRSSLLREAGISDSSNIAH